MREECESLLSKTLALPKPEAKTFSLCERLRSARSTPAGYRDTEEGHRRVSRRARRGHHHASEISGHFRIGVIATRTGDVNEAIEAYETILGNLGDLKSSRLDEFLCHMHLAEILRNVPGKEQAATERLREAVRVAASFGEDASQEDSIRTARLLRSWATYELARLRPDEASADPGPDPNALTSLSSCWMLAVVWAEHQLSFHAGVGADGWLGSLVGPARSCGTRTGDRLSAQIKSIQSGEVPAAGCRRSLLFRMQGRASLDAVSRTDQANARANPVLLNDLKYGSLEQQEQAVSELQSSSGPEGIKALLNAQEDPDRRVRCLAACALATQSLDRSVKAKFDPILEALRMRNPGYAKWRSSRWFSVHAWSSAPERWLLWPSS